MNKPNTNTTDLLQFVKKLPSLPGVYRMLDKDGVVLYVGKAHHLKKRVSSYFNKKDNSAKTRSLVEQIASIDIQITRSETEALLLESNLIKSIRPKYNVLMRDDKSYPYIYVNTGHAFPRIEMLRLKKKPPKGQYFGPYPSVNAVRESLVLLQKIFKIRNCRDSYFNARTRPCLQYQIQRCTAPCTGYISEEDYQQSLRDAILFLQGKSPLIMNSLTERMERAVERLAFEEAAVIRDQIKNLRKVQESQGVILPAGEMDVLVLKARPGFACVLCVSVRNGQIINKESFFPLVPEVALDETNDLCQQVFDAFVAFYYLEKKDRIPAKLIVDENISDVTTTELLLSELRGKRVRIQNRVRGAKKRFLDFAHDNLNLSIAEQASMEEGIAKRYQALADFLQLDQPINRMECFDISHTQGAATVASCVVFGSGGPDKKAYRQFNITGIAPGDDYAAMEQALTRRYQRLILEGPLPDLLIIDGGKGQVGRAQQVLDKLQVKDLCLLGIAKGPGRKAGLEQLIFKGQELRLPETSPALHLLQYIRDEAHRFAVSKHRKKRKNLSFESSLEAIEGVGDKRRQALLRHFGGRQEIARAAICDIAKVHGISQKLATSIYEHFHPEQGN